jgi:hypothetical protein
MSNERAAGALSSTIRALSGPFIGRAGFQATFGSLGENQLRAALEQARLLPLAKGHGPDGVPGDRLAGVEDV